MHKISISHPAGRRQLTLQVPICSIIRERQPTMELVSPNGLPRYQVPPALIPAVGFHLRQPSGHAVLERRGTAMRQVAAAPRPRAMFMECLSSS